LTRRHERIEANPLKFPLDIHSERSKVSFEPTLQNDDLNTFVHQMWGDSEYESSSDDDTSSDDQSSSDHESSSEDESDSEDGHIDCSEESEDVIAERQSRRS